MAQSKYALLNSIQNVHYPKLLRMDGAISYWREHYKEIDSGNKELLDNITNKAGIYALFSLKEKGQWELVYIGQTQSKTSKQRIRSHIVWRNKKTKSGKFTGSQFDGVQEIVMSGKELGFSFVEIYPASLRHYVEENLIEKLNPPWNKQKVNKKKV
jgi:hypothetical protein